MPEGDRLGVLEPAAPPTHRARRLTVENISVLLDKRRIRAVHSPAS